MGSIEGRQASNMQVVRHMDSAAPKQARDDPPGGPSVFTGAGRASAEAAPTDDGAAPPAPPGFELLSDALVQQEEWPTIFPTLNWASVEKAHTLAKVKTLPVSCDQASKRMKTSGTLQRGQRVVNDAREFLRRPSNLSRIFLRRRASRPP